MYDKVAAGFELSPQQLHIWSLDHGRPSTAFRAGCVVSIEGLLEEPRLREAIERTILRHEILRTTFHLLDGLKAPVQVVHEQARYAHHTYDLRGLIVQQQHAEHEAIAEEMNNRSLDLAAGPLLHTALVSLSPQRHLLRINMPSMCGDTPSLANLVREIVHFYAEPQRSLISNVMQYADLAAALIELLEADEAVEGRSYWQQVCACVDDGESPLPFRRRTRNAEFSPAVISMRLPFELGQGLARLAARHDTSSAAVLLTCWNVLLWHWTVKPDLFTTWVAQDGRTYEELSTVIGAITKNVPLSVQLDTGTTFVDVLSQVDEGIRQGSKWQEYFTPGLVAVGGPGSQRVSPVCFEACELPPALHAEDTSFRILEARSYSEPFHLKLYCYAQEAGISEIELHYDESVYRRETVENLAEQFLTLVDSAIASPHGVLGDLQLLTAAEQRRRVLDGNDTARSFPTGKCIHHLVDEQARRTPGRVAVSIEDQELTYAELVSRSDLLCQRLRGLGVGPEVAVAVCAERSLELVVALLAILKAGGFYVPLEPEHPKERLAFLLNDSKASLLLVQQKLVERVPSELVQVVLLDGPSDDSEAVGEVNTKLEATDDNLAYVIYTSGSTGHPKGVMIQHRAIVNRLLWGQATYNLTIADKVLQSAPLGFDFSVWEIFAALISGAELVLAVPEGHRDSAYLAQLIAEKKITIAHFAPSMLQAMLEQPRFLTCETLRLVFSGGEALPIELQDRFCETLASELYNQYGPTEAAVDVTFWRCRYDDERSVPIGRPIANTQIYLLDSQLRPVPCGVPGELYIGGINLARGYLHRPDLTAAHFIPHPFGDEAGLRLYRSGDLARFRPDGSIEFLGRLDHQVKIRGVRIELGEIETALRAHPDLRDATVQAREIQSGSKALVAYVVPRAQSVVHKNELVNYLRTFLPEYMTPAAFVVLKTLPLLPSGKIDYRALPPPAESDLERTEFLAARDPLEELIAEIWAGLLGLERVGANHNFFELGGHSLLGTQIVARVRTATGVDLPLRTLFERPTVAGMAAEVRRLRLAGDALLPPPFERASRSGALPLSFAQQRLWFLEQFEPGTPRYNCPAAVRLTGVLDVSAFRRAFDQIVRRHEVLRTVFRRVGGQASQLVADELSLSLPVHDLSSLPEVEREAGMWKLYGVDAEQSFDLEYGPLLRVSLVRLSESEHVALITMHHIVSDGWSVEVLLQEFGKLYAAYSARNDRTLPELAFQYVDYAVWQRAWMQGEELEKQLDYWRKQLRGAPAALDLSLDYPRPPLRSFGGGSRSFAVSPQVVSALRDLGRREGATMFMTVLAAWVVLLWRYSGQTDICVGTPVANRTHSEIEDLIGFFANTLVLRTDLSGEPTFSQLLQRVRNTTLDAYTHQEVPFEKVVEALQPERELSHTPLFQVMFAFRHAAHTKLSLPDLSVDLILTPPAGARFDLTLNLTEDEHSLSGSLEYSSDLFEPATIDAMIGHFQNLLEGIAARSSERITRFTLLTETEQQQLLPEPLPVEDLLRHPTLHECFVAQVERTSSAPAVTFGGETLSYGELNRRANRLARHLRGLDVEVETLVAICLEPSVEMIVAILGVLKAGAAYVPLDPAYPIERLSYILEDAKAPVLLTTSVLSSRVPVTTARTVYLDSLAETAPDSDENLPSFATASNLAYVIYTSGSTGRPKGVLVTHGNVLRLFTSSRHLFDIDDADVWTMFHSYAFDFSVWEIWELCSTEGVCSFCRVR